MTSPDPKDTSPRETSRVPFETKVNLEFEKFSGFITEYSSNISPGGMFVKTKDPKPVGTILSFDFKLSDNFKLIQGMGEVIWVRTQDVGPDKPAGMGIRFHDLDAQSRELITTMVDQYVKQGGKPFELESPGSPALDSPVPGSSPRAPEEKKAVEDDFRALFAIPDPPSIDPSLDPSIDPLPPPTPEKSTPSLPPPPPRPTPAKAKPPTKGGKPPSKILIEDSLVSSGPGLAERLEERRSPSRFYSPELARPRSSPIVKWGTILITIGVIGQAAYLYRSKLLELTDLVYVGLGGKKEISANVNPTPRPTPAEIPKVLAQMTQMPLAVETPPPPTSAPVATDSQLTLIEEITWEEKGGETVVSLRGDGTIGEGRFSSIRVDARPPREVVKLTGIRQPFPSPRLAVNSSHLRRIRIGYHAGEHGGELHIVLDLAASNIKMKNLIPDGSRLLIHVGN